MSDSLPNPERTEPLDDITARFESAWKEALRSGSAPTIATYVESAAPEQREAVRQRLATVDAMYRRLSDSEAARSATVEVPPSGPATAANIAGQMTTDGDGTGGPSGGPWPHVPGYEIEGELGRGGMGVVYKARQIDLQRPVALKMILAGAHASAVQLERFRAEARAEARLQHPNIVQVYEIGTHDGLPYFSLEFVDGGNLSQKAGRQPQPPREAAQLVETLARAAHYAHKSGIIHRDLKPANVLLASGEASAPRSTQRGADASPLASYTPKIADFGLAKCLDDESGSTRTGLLIGTPSYMAPEQASGQSRDVTRATDVYALGAILYELLTGRPPFLAATVLDTVEQVRTAEAVPPTRLQPRLPRDLETICLKCLHKDARKRYAGADELADDLHRFLRGEPIQTRPVGTTERLWRWCRRNPRVAALSAAVALLLVASTVGAMVFAYLIDRKQRETEQARIDAVQTQDAAEKNAKRAQDESERADANARVADANARDADARYDLALEALNVVVVKVQNQLENTPATERVRTEILQEAMKVLQKSADQGDRKGLSQRGLASAHMVLGNLFWEKGNRDEAAKEFDNCHRILTELYRAHPDSDKATGNFAASLCKQADMDADLRRDLPAAQGRYREALTIQEDLLAHPRPNAELTPTEIKASIANSYTRLAEIAERLGPAAGDDAEALLEKALQLRKEVADAGASAGAKKELSHVHTLLGDLQWKRHKESDAIKHYEAALPLIVAAVREDPHSVRFKSELLLLCGNAGDKIFLRGETARARPFYAASIASAEQMAAVDGRLIVHRTLGQNYYRLATACLRLNDGPGADSNYAKCLAVRERIYAANRKDDRFAIEVMLARARCGQIEKAIEMADDLMQRRGHEPIDRIQTACCYALCMSAVTHGKTPAQLTAEDRSRQQRYTAEAVESLRAARANGYQDVHNLEIEPDLDPIRTAPEFVSFMREFRGDSK